MISLLDNDLYKFTMQQAVLELYPNTHAVYKFYNRDKDRQIDMRFLHDEITRIGDLRLRGEEMEWLSLHCPYFKPAYRAYLKNFRYDPCEVLINKEGITVSGPWHSTIMWEVPILAAVSELHFRNSPETKDYMERTEWKRDQLRSWGAEYSDFGTRRRRSAKLHDAVVECLTGDDNFLGTSNVALAMKHGIEPVGTMAHEWIMAHSALFGLHRANFHALEGWVKVYRGHLGIALTDTYTSEVFYGDFDLLLSKAYDGVRHDSGSPFAFADRAVKHYQRRGIDPLTKKIIFSDGLTPHIVHKLLQWCKGKIGCAFGIGTNLTNDCGDALNIVMKLDKLDGIPLVKLSDVPTKATGDADALRIAKHVLLGEKL